MTVLFYKGNPYPRKDSLYTEMVTCCLEAMSGLMPQGHRAVMHGLCDSLDKSRVLLV